MRARRGVFVSVLGGVLVLVLSMTASAVDLGLTARSGVLMDAGSGRIIYEKDMHAKQPIASLTKIMTMTLALEALRDGKIKLDDIVVGSALAKSMGGTQIWLEEGEQLTVKDMLYAIGVGSANDCAVALGEFLGGSFDGFVEAMNKKAKAMGLADTHFSNPTGLDDQGNYSSAHDLAVLSRYAITLPMFLEISSTWEYWVRKGTPKEIWLTTFNKLLKSYPGYDGIKTGFTEEAMYCLASTAKRGGLRMIGVVLGEPTPQARAADVSRILDYGFRVYQAVEIAQAGADMGAADVLRGQERKVKLVTKDDFFVSIPRDGSKEFSQSVVLNPGRLYAPVKKGQILGKLVARQGKNVVGQMDLVAAEDVARGNLFRFVFQVTGEVIRSLFGGR